MKYRPITDMTDQEIEFLWKDILKINKVIYVKRNIEENKIKVEFESTWGEGTELDPYFDIEDMVIMHPDKFNEMDYPVNLEEKFKYQQYMIAKGYSKYWKDNPYIDD